MKKFLFVASLIALSSVESMATDDPLKYYNAPYGVVKLADKPHLTHWLTSSVSTIDGVPECKYVYTYDESLRHTGYAEYRVDEQTGGWQSEPLNRLTYAFNEWGLTTLYVDTTYEFDQYGRVVKISFRDEGQKCYCVTDYTYDTEGYTLLQVCNLIFDDGHMEPSYQYIGTHTVNNGVTELTWFFSQPDENGNMRELSGYISRSYEDDDKRWTQAIDKEFDGSELVVTKDVYSEDRCLVPGKDYTWLEYDQVYKERVNGKLAVTRKYTSCDVTDMTDDAFTVETHYVKYTGDDLTPVYYKVVRHYQILTNSDGTKMGFNNIEKIYSSPREDGDWNPVVEAERRLDDRHSMVYSAIRRYEEVGDSRKTTWERDELGRVMKHCEYFYRDDWRLEMEDTYEYCDDTDTRVRFLRKRYDYNTGELCSDICYEWEYDFDIPQSDCQTYGAYCMHFTEASNEYMMTLERITSSDGKVTETRFNYNEDIDLSGINAVKPAADTSAVFYTISGIRVDSSRLTPGIYIRVDGVNATKVLIK